MKNRRCEIEERENIYETKFPMKLKVLFGNFWEYQQKLFPNITMSTQQVNACSKSIIKTLINL